MYEVSEIIRKRQDCLVEETTGDPEVRKYVYRLAGPIHALESKPEMNHTIEDPTQKSSLS